MQEGEWRAIASLDLSALNGTNGFVANGIDASDLSGRSVAAAGDVNGDGISRCNLLLAARQRPELQRRPKKGRRRASDCKVQRWCPGPASHVRANYLKYSRISKILTLDVTTKIPTHYKSTFLRDLVCLIEAARSSCKNALAKVFAVQCRSIAQVAARQHPPPTLGVPPALRRSSTDRSAAEAFFASPGEGARAPDSQIFHVAIETPR
jgi:hypothetical protein